MQPNIVYLYLLYSAANHRLCYYINKYKPTTAYGMQPFAIFIMQNYACIHMEMHA